jgi:hypothetical protein
MSRNTFILLGLLTGSVALVGCSKNITAPSVETDRQAEALTSQAVPVDEIQVDNEVGPTDPKRSGTGNKLRRNLIDDQVGEEGVEVLQPKQESIGKDGRTRDEMTDKEAGLGGQATSSKSKRSLNKLRQLMIEN